ncbi:MAG: HAMP domain-containing sensor histidine kinase [Myxococcota bacterium]|nr:HAMP domain-containing sensor histidine kinase [Myxococcota bacterium]
MNKGTIQSPVANPSSTNLLRLTSSWGLAFALFLLAGIGILQAWSLFSKMDEEELGRIEGELQRLVLHTELEVSMRARQWLSEMETSQDEDLFRSLEFREQELRKEWPTFDAFYIWDEGPEGVVLHYPPDNTPDSLYRNKLESHLQEADRFHAVSDFDSEIRLLQETVDEAMRYLKGQEISPSLTRLGERWQDSFESLKQGHPEASVRITESLARLSKRHQVYRNIITSNASVLPSVGQQPSLFYELAGDSTLLLAARKLENSNRFIAVQVDQNAILQSMLLRSTSLRRYLVIRDAQGNRLAGNPTSELELAEVPCRTLLPHLRLSSKEGLLQKRQSDHQWSLLWQIVPILIAVLLGSFALSARQTADRRAHTLLVRQREFVTRVTHELKTPLAGIRVMAESLEMGAYEKSESVREFALRIISETDRLNQRVEEVLDIGTRQSVNVPEPVNLTPLLTDLADEWSPRYANTGIVLHQEVGRVPNILGDEQILRDAVACLLDNALKYHDPMKAPPEVWLRLAGVGPRLVIEVEDNGMGVPTSKRTEIFQRFARVEGENRGKSGGHGLGLAIAREAIEQHDGSIQCRDGVDGGVCFTISLPIKGLLSRRMTT